MMLLLLLFLIFPIHFSEAAIEDVMRAALYNNATLKSEYCKILSTNNLAHGDSLAMFPTAYISMNYDHNINLKDKYLVVSQPLFDSGRSIFTSGIQKAKLDKYQASFMLAKQNLLIQVVDIYMNLLEQKELLQLYENNLHVAYENLHAVQRKLSLGEATKSEELRALAHLQEAKYNNLQAQSETKVSEALYLSIVGEDPEDLYFPTDLPICSQQLQELLEDAACSHPRILMYQHDLEATKSKKRLILSELLPSISAKVTFNEDIQLGTISTDVGFSVYIPVFNKGQEYANIRDADLLYRQQSHNISQILNDIRKDIHISWHEFQTSIALENSLEGSIIAAEDAVASVYKCIDVGLCSHFEALDIENNLLRARIAMVRAKVKHISSLYKVLLNSNRFIERFDVPSKC